MNLEHVSAEKSHYRPTEIRPKPIQLSIFAKISLRPTYQVSNQQIDRILRRISAEGLCGSDRVRDYLRRQLRHSCRPNTLRTSGTTIVMFLAFFKRSGGQDLSAIGPEHIGAFVEHEQDRGLAAVSVDVRLKGLYAFLNYLVGKNLISAEVIKRKLRIRVPEALPRAIDPEDIQQLLGAHQKATRSGADTDPSSHRHAHRGAFKHPGGGSQPEREMGSDLRGAEKPSGPDRLS